MEATAILVSVGAFMSALFGGIVAARATRSVGAIIAVGAGIRIGAAFFDLIPESVDLLGSLDRAMVCTAIGFLAFYAVEKMTTLHVGHETATEMDHAAPNHRHDRKTALDPDPQQLTGYRLRSLDQRLPRL